MSLGPITKCKRPGSDRRGKNEWPRYRLWVHHEHDCSDDDPCSERTDPPREKPKKGGR